jgi:hypothetical protein
MKVVKTRRAKIKKCPSEAFLMNLYNSFFNEVRETGCSDAE